MPPLTSITPDSVLLVGCGKLGIELGEHLAAAGTTVHALRRDPAHLPAALAPVAVDLTKPVSQPLPVVDTMVITLTPTMPDVAGQPGYLVALNNLADALPRVPSRVVFVSSTRVFEGHHETQPITEHDAPTPVSERGQLLVAAEQRAVELFEAKVVRPAGIYGPGRDMLIRKVQGRQPVQYGRRTNRIHQTDLARALRMMLTMPNPPEILHALDHAPGVLLGDVVRHIAMRLHVAAPPAVEPAETSGKILDGRLLHSVLGPLYYPTFREGYDQVIAAQPA